MVNASGPPAQLSRSRRPFRAPSALLLGLIGLAACRDGSEPEVSTRSPRSDAGASPTLFSPSGTLGGVAVVEIDRLTSTPISFAPAPDGRLFIVQRKGLIRIYADGRLLPNPFLDLSEEVTENGEGGLLSMALHPRFAENGRFFVDYTNLEGNTVVASYRPKETDPNLADPQSATTLLAIDQPYSNHNGGQLQFGPDGYLYIGMGDGGSGGDPACNAQRPETLLGKMLRIDVDHPENRTGGRPYAIPPDNPFLGANPLPDEAWAIGLRNPWRFSFDRANGDLWIGDVGQNRREEIDHLPAGTPPGRNFGWKPMEASLCYGDERCPGTTPPCGAPEFVAPVLEYDHDDGDCSVTGGYVYRGRAIPALAGRYLFADYCSGKVWAAAPGANGYDVKKLDLEAPFVVTFGEDQAGEIWLGTLEGKVLRLVPKN